MMKPVMTAVPEAASAPEFTHWLASRQQQVQQALLQVFSEPAGESRLQAAMQYAVLAGGKRLRPLLAYAAAEAVGGTANCADTAACAVECIHAYSLIHDDLPAMDDDVLRRGQPTCHVKFDEATAILAGDALQALAFELLATATQPALDAQVKLHMVQELALASGRNGMVAGQAMDIAATGSQPAESSLSRMHQLKTGALISASVMLGALSTGHATATQLAALRRFAQAAGLSFQIQDDILDVEASTAVTGKQQGKDARAHKATYTSVLGVEGAKLRLAQVTADAQAALQDLGTSADMLRLLAQYLAERKA